MTLVCLGSSVSIMDTYNYWKFNGKKIRGGYSKWQTERNANFYLHITNVSEKDIGEYQCVAMVANTHNAKPPDVIEAFIELQLYESGT